MSYVQFKLTSGEEIVAEVLEEELDEAGNLVVRRAMLILTAEAVQGNIRYYSFRPWMTYQNSSEYMQLLNSNHIIGEAKPDNYLLEQYKMFVQESEKFSEDRDEKLQKRYDELMAHLEHIHGELGGDSDSNVISFVDRRRLH